MTGPIRKRLKMILLPGWACTARVWADVLPRLEEFAVPEPMDLPVVTTGKADATLPHLAGQLLMAAPHDALWIGWSLGGLVAAQAAFMAPRRIRALVLVACTPKFTRGPDWPCATAPDLFAGFQRALAKDRAGALRRFAALCAHDGSRADVSITRGLTQALQSSRESNGANLEAGLKILEHTDLRLNFRALSCPLLCILGGGDMLVPIDVAGAIAALNPRIRVTRIADAGHAPFMSHPAGFSAVVREFCDGL